jgi:hypothetical protein
VKRKERVNKALKDARATLQRGTSATRVCAPPRWVNRITNRKVENPNPVATQSSVFKHLQQGDVRRGGWENSSFSSNGSVAILFLDTAQNKSYKKTTAKKRVPPTPSTSQKNPETSYNTTTNALRHEETK